MRGEAEIADPIRSGGELRDITHRCHPVRPYIGANVAPDIATQTEDRAVAIERNLEVALRLTRMSDGHEMLAPILHPFDRTAELACRKRNQKIFWIELAARAPPPADRAQPPGPPACTASSASPALSATTIATGSPT